MKFVNPAAKTLETRLLSYMEKFANGWMSPKVHFTFSGSFKDQLILQATGDLRKVALWLGCAHMQTTEINLRADPTEKIEAIEGIMLMSLRRGKFSVPDKLIASLRGE